MYLHQQALQYSTAYKYIPRPTAIVLFTESYTGYTLLYYAYFKYCKSILSLYFTVTTFPHLSRPSYLSLSLSLSLMNRIFFCLSGETKKVEKRKIMSPMRRSFKTKRENSKTKKMLRTSLIKKKFLSIAKIHFKIIADFIFCVRVILFLTFKMFLDLIHCSLCNIYFYYL